MNFAESYGNLFGDLLRWGYAPERIALTNCILVEGVELYLSPALGGSIHLRLTDPFNIFLSTKEYHSLNWAHMRSVRDYLRGTEPRLYPYAAKQSHDCMSHIMGVSVFIYSDKKQIAPTLDRYVFEHYVYEMSHSYELLTYLIPRAVDAVEAKSAMWSTGNNEPSPEQSIAMLKAMYADRTKKKVNATATMQQDANGEWVEYDPFEEVQE